MKKKLSFMATLCYGHCLDLKFRVARIAGIVRCRIIFDQWYRRFVRKNEFHNSLYR